ncbi:E3 ubiquitin-protein ligase RNF25 isoform X2 [Denticeps clupeoides]|nr:E3 ubiquitin-protein ligase RNF25 isoform X2 [Denticeps clupeoides]
MAAESDVLSEMEVLQSIYLDELKVAQRENGHWEVSLVLYPSTGEDALSQFVRLTLMLTLDSQYPLSPPSITIRNPRGLSDNKLLSVQRSLQVEAESCPGSPVLYQLIERAKEILTESNVPHGNCVICLYGFKEGEAFTKTHCYHYFHSHCLGRYIRHSETELKEREREQEEDKSRGREYEEELAVVCPVCREPLTYDVDALLTSPAPHLPKVEDENLGADFRRKWEELRSVLERQREKGGIIDAEAESNRFLIHINETSSDPGAPPSVPPDAASSQPASQPAALEAATSQAQQVPVHSRGRGRAGRKHHFKGGGRRGHGTQVHSETSRPVFEDFSSLSLSSGKCEHVDFRKAHFERRPHALAHCKQEAEAAVDGGVSPDLRQRRVLLSADCQKTACNSSTDDAKPPEKMPADGARGCEERERRRRGPRCSGQTSGQWAERGFPEPELREPTRPWHHRGDFRAYRGRGRDGFNPRRAGGAPRGDQRCLHQKSNEAGTEKVAL